MTMWRLTETYRGERHVYVQAGSRSEALRLARDGSGILDADDPDHFAYRYSGPVVEVETGPDRTQDAA